VLHGVNKFIIIIIIIIIIRCILCHVRTLIEVAFVLRPPHTSAILLNTIISY